MYLYVLMVSFFCITSFVHGSEVPTVQQSSDKPKFPKAKLSKELSDRLSQTLGESTVVLFVNNATKNEKEKKEAEKKEPIVLKTFSPGKRSTNNYMTQKKAHNTKTPRAWCCGLSNEE